MATILVAVVAQPIVSATPIAEWARLARFPLDQYATVAGIVLGTAVTGRLLHADGSVWKRSGCGAGAWRGPTGAAALGTGLLVVAAPALLVAALGGARFETSSATESPAFATWAAVALLAPAALAEELLFRGYAFDACVEGIGRTGAVIATSAAFGLAHLFNPDPTALSIAAVAAAGVFLAAVRLATGSVMTATAAHFGVNAMQVIGLHASVSGIALQAPGYRYVATGPAWLTGGAWGPEASIGVMAAFAAATFLYLRRARNGVVGRGTTNSGT